MGEYAVLFNLLLLIGVGSVVGCFVVIMIISGKLNKINQNLSELNQNLIKFNSKYIENSRSNPMPSEDLNSQARVSRNSGDLKIYESEQESQTAAYRKENLLQENEDENRTKTYVKKEKSIKPEVGIIFCRNCTSQYTSDKEICPICGVKKQQ